MRCFIGIMLPKYQAITKLQEEFRDDLDGKLTEAENIHLTLKFLGEIDEEKIEFVKRRLAQIRFKPFNIRLSRCGLFSRHKRNILWVDAESERLDALQKEIDHRLKEEFEPENRFMGHITIARPKKITQELEKKIKAIEVDETIRVEQFSLMRSETKHSGPTYERVERYTSET